MANRTVKDAHSIHGTNPQYLVEKIIRTRIYESKYWKEECFGLTAELVVDKAMELKYIGGVYGGNIKPAPFLCLTLKMLQIQPEKDIIVEFIKNEDFKLMEVFIFAEFELMHVDEFIDLLLHDERCCDIILPRLQKRFVLEEAELLDTRVSALEEDLDDVESSEEEDDDEDDRLERPPSVDHYRRGYRDLDRPRRSPSPRYRRSRSRSPRRRSRSPKRRSPSPRRERHRSKSPRRHRSRSRDRRHRSKSPGHHRSHRHRSHSKSPERSKKSHKKSRRGNE
ncbi:pre-mRNA-splicing factor 38A [Protopterus annectens]|uniref:pre-mRNA-splicing factor 38A n=1 Tax=Protopterus annectens TaxID=7888 RepID=UPI001CFB7DE6|nr:pre-mRNA-splicing factor 38A [Protopterus annectens]